MRLFFLLYGMRSGCFCFAGSKLRSTFLCFRAMVVRKRWMVPNSVRMRKRPSRSQSNSIISAKPDADCRSGIRFFTSEKRLVKGTPQKGAVRNNFAQNWLREQKHKNVWSTIGRDKVVNAN